MSDDNPTLNLKVEFSREQIAEYAQQLARGMGDLGQLELDKKALATAMKERIEAQEALCAKFARWVRDGYDFREVEVRWEMNTPRIGIKTAIRQDTWVECETQPMTDSERQQNLPFGEESPKKGRK